MNPLGTIYKVLFGKINRHSRSIALKVHAILTNIPETIFFAQRIL